MMTAASSDRRGMRRPGRVAAWGRRRCCGRSSPGWCTGRSFPRASWPEQNSPRGRGTTPATSAWFGPNLGPTHRARQHAETFSGRLHRARTLRQGRVTRSADLGVKGSRVQISPARLSKLPSQTVNSFALLTWFHDRFHLLTTFYDHLFHERASLSRVSASRETCGLTCP
jgi:hypothetical protein